MNSKTMVSAIALMSYFFACMSPADAADANVKPVGKKSLGGSGQMIQLELPGDSRMLSGIEVHGARYGAVAPPEEKFLVYLLNAEMTKVTAVEMAPYSLFERGEERWVGIKFEKPIEFPKNGWVAVDFRAGRTKGVYVSYDESDNSKRSRIGLPGIPSKEVDFEGNWMIRPMVAQ